MGKMKENIIDLEIVCMLELCSFNDLQYLSSEEQYNLLLKAKNTLNKADELGICSVSEALNTYTYEELEKLIKEYEN